MMALVAAVFLASVLGSLHCVGMCGAFLALAFNDTEGTTSRWRLSAGYHGGRLVTYTLLGVAAGALGSLLDMAGALAGLQRVAMPLAGLTVAVFGVVSLLRLRGVVIKGFSLPMGLRRFVSNAQGVAMRFTPAKRALAIGLLTTLLPCGWLYAFVVTAAGTADALTGGLVMAVFWAGTLPALVSVGLGVKRLAGAMGRGLQTATCVALIVMGLWAVVGRSHLDPVALAHVVIERAEQQSGVAMPDASEDAACCELGALREASE